MHLTYLLLLYIIYILIYEGHKIVKLDDGTHSGLHVVKGIVVLMSD